MHPEVRWARALCRAALTLALLGAPAALRAEPLTLPVALARAQQGSPALAAARAELDAAKARLRQAGLGPNPEASVLAENLGGSGAYRGIDSVQTTLGLSQRLELGGKRGARSVVARAEVRVADLRLRIAGADLARDVRLRFAEAVAAADRARVQREAADRDERLAEVVKTLVDEGREAPLRAARARTQAAAGKARAESEETAAAAARRALAGLWGGDAEGLEPVESETPPPSVAADPLQSLDLALAEAEVEVAHAAVEREKTAAAPDLTLQAGVRSFGDSGDRALVFGASAPIPIFNRNQGGVAAARAEAVVAEARRLQALAAAVRAQADARAALRSAQARLEAALTGAEPLARDALDLARQGYAAGKFGLIDVLDAQAALGATQSEVIDARLARAQAVAALERASARQEEIHP